MSPFSQGESEAKEHDSGSGHRGCEDKTAMIRVDGKRLSTLMVLFSMVLFWS